MSTRFSSAEQMLKAQGLDLGVTDWLQLTQARSICSPKPLAISSGYMSTLSAPPMARSGRASPMAT